MKDTSITRLSGVSNVPSVGPEATHVESLRNVLREKDRESYTFLHIIENLRRENKKIKGKQTVGRDVKQLDELQYKFDSMDKENKWLKAEITALKRI